MLELLFCGKTLFIKYEFIIQICKNLYSFYLYFMIEIEDYNNIYNLKKKSSIRHINRKLEVFIARFLKNRAIMPWSCKPVFTL